MGGPGVGVVVAGVGVDGTGVGVGVGVGVGLPGSGDGVGSGEGSAVAVGSGGTGASTAVVGWSPGPTVGDAEGSGDEGVADTVAAPVARVPGGGGPVGVAGPPPQLPVATDDGLGSTR